MGRNRRVSDDEILAVFRETTDPILTASEVASELPLSRRGIYDRLQNLQDEGVLQSKKVGGRTTVWWLPGHTATNNES